MAQINPRPGQDFSPGEDGEAGMNGSAAGQTLEDCREALVETQRQAVDLKDKWLRAAAQVENTRKSAERDATARMLESRRALLRQLLEVIDNLERALAHPGDAGSLTRGVEITHRQLETVLERAGAERLEVEPGQPFDPAYQEAVEVRSGNLPEPVVAAVVQPGYLHEGVLLRPARVVVVR